MYDTFQAAIMDDLFDDAIGNPVQSRSHTYDAYDDSFDAYEEDIDEAVYRVFRSGRMGFHVDPARVDIESNPNEIRNALTGQDPNVVGVWVTGGPRNARWVARQAGFPTAIVHQGHPVGRGIPVGQPHLHGVNSSGRESELHIF